jgi:hypothetical protein
MIAGGCVRMPNEKTLNPAGGGPRTDDCNHLDAGFKRGFKKGALPLYTPSFILAVNSNHLDKAPFGIIVSHNFGN